MAAGPDPSALADAPASLADSIAAKGGEYPDWASVWLVVTPSACCPTRPLAGRPRRGE
jgi:hypothetical protein